MQNYKEFEIYANAGTKFIKILKIIYLDYYPSRNFSWKYRHFPKKIDRRHICSQSSQSSQIIK